MYESFYLRAVNPDERVSIWIRFTVQKASGRPPMGSAPVLGWRVSRAKFGQ